MDTQSTPKWRKFWDWTKNIYAAFGFLDTAIAFPSVVRTLATLVTGVAAAAVPLLFDTPLLARALIGIAVVAAAPWLFLGVIRLAESRSGGRVFKKRESVAAENSAAPENPAPESAVEELRKLYPKLRYAFQDVQAFYLNKVFRGHDQPGTSSNPYNIIYYLFRDNVLHPFDGVAKDLERSAEAKNVLGTTPLTQAELENFLKMLCEALLGYRNLMSWLGRLMQCYSATREDLFTLSDYRRMYDFHEDCLKRLDDASHVSALRLLNHCIPPSLPTPKYERKIKNAE